MCIFGLFGISSFSTVIAKEALKVSVSIVPQRYFVEKIGGDLVDVSVMVLPGANPATYEPKPRQMVALTVSEIYFAVGVPFEGVWLKKFIGVNPEMMVVHTEDGIDKMPMISGRHHEDKRHRHGVEDPHIWLSPPLVMLQARNILDALLKVNPENKEMFEANYKAFIMELVDLDSEIRGILGDNKDVCFMVYHPAWGYFAEAYGLRQIPVEIEGKRPTPKELGGLILRAVEDGIKVLFVQPQFSVKNADIIAKAIGGQVMFADPLRLDWAENLVEVAEKFKGCGN